MITCKFFLKAAYLFTNFYIAILMFNVYYISEAAMFVIFLSLTSKQKLGSFNRVLAVVPTFEGRTKGALRTPTCISGG